MTSTQNARRLGGCDVTPLDSEAACIPFLKWIAGQGETVPADAAGLRWALAHCDDGVTWGRYDTGTRVWYLGSQAAPEVSPPIRRETLQELRLFGDLHEVLIWRADTELRGRILRDSAAAAGHDDDDPLRPSDEARVLRGSSGQALPLDFTHVHDAAGAQQVVPMALTDAQLSGSKARLNVRHYYEADPCTGAVRVAATRLVDVDVLRGA